MSSTSEPPLELIATAAAGTEAIVKRELAALGYTARTVTPGRLLFHGDAVAICRTNLWLRVAERVLIRVGTFPATDFGQLFDGTAARAWEQWLPRDAEFPVDGRSHHSQLSSVPACQRIVKRAIVERLRTAHATEELPETGPRYSIEISLRDDVATLTLDTTGVGLHKRGYRPLVGEAQLRETLAAAMVQLSFWRPGRVLADPFCGTGTIPIEAALIGRNIAPGLRREFASEFWPALDADLWRTAREEARDLIRPNLTERLLAYDIDAETLSLARYHAQQAGVAEDIHWQERPFSELREGRVRLHHHESAIWRANGRGPADRRTLPFIPAGSAKIADVVALYIIGTAGPRSTCRAASDAAAQALQRTDRVHVLSVPRAPSAA